MSKESSESDLGFFIALCGYLMMVAGGLALGAIFLIVFVWGTWPAFLEPVRSFLATGSSYLGPFWFPVLIMIILAPGYLIQEIGKSLIKK